MTGRRSQLALLITAASLVALAVSSYLTWTTLTASPTAGCDVSSSINCSEVQSSKWAYLFGIPVSVLACVTYGIILALCWPATNRPRSLAMTALLAFSLAALGAAAWFVYLQAAVIGSFCLYCMIAHVCALGVGLCALWMSLLPGEQRDASQMRSLLGVSSTHSTKGPPPSSGLGALKTVAAVLVASAGLGGLIAAQVASEEPKMEMQEITLAPASDTVSQGPQSPEPAPEEEDAEENAASPPAEEEEARLFSFEGLPDLIDLRDAPLLGSPDAKYAMVELLDYTCDHCRELHTHVHHAVEHYSDDLAVVIYHVPLSSKCNPHVPEGRKGKGKRNACDYAQLAINVWKLKPHRFAEYHNWLMEGEKPPRVIEARKRAMRICGDNILLDSQLRQESLRRISKQSELLSRIRKLPVLLFPQGAMAGIPKSQEAFLQVLQTKLGLEPPVDQGPAGSGALLP